MSTSNTLNIVPSINLNHGTVIRFDAKADAICIDHPVRLSLNDTMVEAEGTFKMFLDDPEGNWHFMVDTQNNIANIAQRAALQNKLGTFKKNATFYIEALCSVLPTPREILLSLHQSGQLS